jgi:hypothetical protein
MKNHLEPLARATNILQGSRCHVDDVLMIFAFLYLRYSALSDPDDLPVRTAVLASIERRWGKTDQDVFVAGILLNPFHKARPFRAAPFSTAAGLYNLIHRLWARFYYEQPPSDLYVEFRAYIHGTGNFSMLENFMSGMRTSAEKEVRSRFLLSQNKNLNANT